METPVSWKLLWLRYVDRVTELLHQKLKQADLLLLKKDLMIQKRQEALEEQTSLEPKLDLLVQKTRELQKLVSIVIKQDLMIFIKAAGVQYWGSA